MEIVEKFSKLTWNVVHQFLLEKYPLPYTNREISEAILGTRFEVADVSNLTRLMAKAGVLKGWKEFPHMAGCPLRYTIGDKPNGKIV